MNYRLRAWAIALLIATAVVFHPAASSSQPAAPASAKSKEIRLVVYVMVDQFRYDYLTRFESAYTAGLRRLLRDGAVFTNAYLEHYPTVTAAGHATLGTGAMLSTSGIIGNDWYDRATGGQVTSVSDPKVQLLGGASAKDGASPHRLLVSALSDEIKMWSEAAGRTPSKVIGMSLKDRSAILPVGRGADAAYWFDTANGAFVSSTFYQPALPAWVAQFNASHPGASYATKSWPAWQGPTPAPALPAATDKTLYAALYSSPFGNDLLLRFAEAALAAERLGQRDTLDVLSVSFSSNDAVGHAFGPDSPEVRAISIDTDRVLGQLLATIDKTVGLDRTLLVLSADHGVAPLPERLAERHMPGGRMTGEALFGPMRAALVAKYGAGEWLLSTAGSSPYLNYALMAERKVDPAEARTVAAKAVAGLPEVARVFTRDQLLEGRMPQDKFSQRVARSFNAQRSGDLEIVLQPFWMRAAKGTTHGTPYDYDAHLPLIFMGPGIRAGRYHQAAALNDVSPTLAAMLRVTPPSGSAGRVLDEMLDARASVRSAAPAGRPAAPAGATGGGAPASTPTPRR